MRVANALDRFAQLLSQACGNGDYILGTFTFNALCGEKVHLTGRNCDIINSGKCKLSAETRGTNISQTATNKQCLNHGMSLRQILI